MRKDNVFLVTTYDDHLLSIYYENGKALSINVYDDSNDVGNIYVARVDKIVKNINAAFVEYQSGKLAFYSLQSEKPIFLNNKNTDKVVEGDFLLIQISKGAIKTKLPTATSNITLTGNYLVLDQKMDHVSISKKIKDNTVRESLKNMYEGFDVHYGLICRTLCENADLHLVKEEYKKLSNEMDEILNQSKYRTAYSLMRAAKQPYLIDYAHYLSGGTYLVTDIKEIYDQFLDEYKNCELLSLYEDESYPLNSCYSVSSILDEALKKKIWLPCGGYLVIEQTEALTVIDVNSGKAIDGHKKDLAYKVNTEATLEITRQMRLRNLSGIIIIDYINMTSDNEQEMLIDHLKSALMKDPVQAVYVDMTKLSLVEVTRKKTGPSIRQCLINNVNKGENEE